jgi:hypothetical protein
MKESENIQKPQHYADRHDRIQYGLDRSLQVLLRRKLLNLPSP